MLTSFYVHRKFPKKFPLNVKIKTQQNTRFFAIVSALFAAASKDRSEVSQMIPFRSQNNCGANSALNMCQTLYQEL